MKIGDIVKKESIGSFYEVTKINDSICEISTICYRDRFYDRFRKFTYNCKILYDTNDMKSNLIICSKLETHAVKLIISGNSQ